MGMSWTNVAPSSSRRNRVDLTAVVAVGGVHRREGVPVDVVPLERLEPADDPVERGLAALVDAVGVVHRLGPSMETPTRKSCSPEERRPLVVEERGVGLDGVEDPLTGCGVPLLELEGAAEEVEPHHRRLTALEGDHDLVDAALGGEELADVRLVDVGVHPEAAARVELVLGEEEAVLAVEVADRPGGLGHDVEGPRAPSGLVHRHGQPRVEEEPATDLRLVVDVPLSGDVDDHLVDASSRERYGAVYAGVTGEASSRPTHSPSPTRQNAPGWVTISALPDGLAVDVERERPAGPGHHRVLVAARGHELGGDDVRTRARGPGHR